MDKFQLAVCWTLLAIICNLSFSTSILYTACKFRQFRCSDDGKCLETEKLCNSINDCKNSEDELENYCNRTTLSDSCDDSTEFRCRFGGCIPKVNVCDDTPHCWGGTDESLELCYGSNKPTKIPSTTQSVILTNIKNLSTRKTFLVNPGKFKTTTEKATQMPLPSFPSELPQIIKRLTTSTTTRRTTTTEEPLIFSEEVKKQSSEEEDVGKVKPNQSPSKDPKFCPPLELLEGQEISCYHKKLSQNIDCHNRNSPEGTKAEIRCAEFYIALPIGSKKTSKTCENGRWRGGNRKFYCDLDCGMGGHIPKGYISGGETSSKGKWPWHVGIYQNDPPGSENFKQICGGTLINQRAILTAGHCVTFPDTSQVKNSGDFLLFLGKYNRTAFNNDEAVQIRKAIKIHIPKNFFFKNLQSDIAIIWLEKKAEISPFVHPVCLPELDQGSDAAPVGIEGALAGWGSTGDGKFPEMLQESRLPVISSGKCKQSHGSLANLVRKDNFCAGYENGTSACSGDSGGGFVIEDNFEKGKWQIWGIVSGGVQSETGPGCDPNFYAVFTNVAKYKNWINEIIDQGPPI